MKEKNLMPVSDYAKLCGVSTAAIYDRIKLNTLTAEKMTIGKDTCYVIDMDQFPPKKNTPGRKKFIVK